MKTDTELEVKTPSIPIPDQAEWAHVAVYSAQKLMERARVPLAEAVAAIDLAGVTWVHIVEKEHEKSLEVVADKLKLDPLMLLRMITKPRRSTVEPLGGYLIFTLRYLRYSQRLRQAQERVLLVIQGKGLFVTLTDRDDGIFEPMIVRVRNPKSLCRKNGSDYLIYMLLDTIVDDYFVWLENLDLQVSHIEDSFAEDGHMRVHDRIHQLKKQAGTLRKSLWPLREVLHTLQSAEANSLSKVTLAQLSKVHSHTIQAIETVEATRDLLSGLMDLHLSHVSHRLNEVMKLLTIVSTIFVPLTFIVGVYGMNFDYMPELNWKWGYAGVWAVMAVITLYMIFLFRRKKWI
jgi:magnesium transporter